VILLVSTTDKIQVVTTIALATIDVRADAMDAPNPILSGSTQTPYNRHTAVTGITAGTDVVPVPGASTVRNVKGIRIADTHASLAQSVALLIINASSTISLMPATTIQAGERIVVDAEGGLRVYDAQGKLKNTGFTSAAGSASQAQYNDGAGNLAGAAMVEIGPSGNLHLVDNAAGTAPPADRVKLFGRKISGRMLSAFMGPSGLDSALQPMLARNKVGYWNPPGNATTVPGVFGITAPTAIGTATSRSVATTNLATRMRRIGYASNTAAPNLGGARVAAAQFTIGDGGDPALGGFHTIARFVPSDPANVAGARGFVGMLASTAAPTNVEPSTLVNCIGLAQLAASSNMQIVYGGSAAQTPIDLGASFPFNTASVDAYELAIFASPTGDVFYQVTRINTGDVASGQLTGVAGTALPAATTLLCFSAWRCNNATTLAVGIDICSIYIETDQ